MVDYKYVTQEYLEENPNTIIENSILSKLDLKVFQKQ